MAYISLWNDLYRTSCERDCIAGQQCADVLFAFCKVNSDGVSMVDFGLRIDIPGFTKDMIDVTGLPIIGQEPPGPYAITSYWQTSDIWPLELAVRVIYSGCKTSDPGRGDWFLLAKITFNSDVLLEAPPPCSVALIKPDECIYINNPLQTGLNVYGCNPVRVYPLIAQNHFTINQPCDGFISNSENSWGAIKSLY